jgi:hypothetical protein
LPSVQSERSIDVHWQPAHVFAVLSDPRRLAAWSTLVVTAEGTGLADTWNNDAARNDADGWATGERVALRWRWQGRDELVDATLELGDAPFAVRYEATTDDGTRFEVRQQVGEGVSGAHIDVAVDLDIPSATPANNAALQRALDAEVEQMTARLYGLLQRYRAPSDGTTRNDLLPGRETPAPRRSRWHAIRNAIRGCISGARNA